MLSRHGQFLNRRVCQLAALLILLPSSGCESGADGAGDLVAIPTWTMAETPSVSMGGLDERPDYLIEGLLDALRMPEGQIVIADRRASELRVYSPSGEYLRTLGRPGEGPGEFALLAAVVHGGGDTILALDIRRGISRFSIGDGFLDMHTFDVYALSRHACRIGESGRHLLPGPRILSELDSNPSPPECDGPTEGVRRTNMLVGIGHPETGAFDSLAIIPATERDGRNYRQYGGMAAVAYGGGRIAIGDTRGDSILMFDGATGAPEGSIPVPFESRPLTAEATADALRPVSRADDGTIIYGDPWSFPETYPRFARLLPDIEGNVWVMQFPDATGGGSSWTWMRPTSARLPEEGAFWRVVSPDGLVIGEVRTPPGFFALSIGADWILGFVRDPELGVETVQLHTLDRVDR